MGPVLQLPPKSPDLVICLNIHRSYSLGSVWAGGIHLPESIVRLDNVYVRKLMRYKVTLME